MVKSSVFIIIVLLGSPLVAPVLAQKKTTSPQNSLEKLAGDFWQWRARFQPFSKDDIPRIERPGGPRDWSATAIAKQRTTLLDFETRLGKMDPSDWDIAHKVDYRLMGSALARVRWELDIQRRWIVDPTFYLDQTLTALQDELLPPPPFDSTRSHEILTRMENIPQILSDAKANLHPLRPFAGLAIRPGVGGGSGVPSSGPGSTMRAELSTILGSVPTALTGVGQRPVELG